MMMRSFSVRQTSQLLGENAMNGFSSTISLWFEEGPNIKASTETELDDGKYGYIKILSNIDFAKPKVVNCCKIIFILKFDHIYL